MSTIRRDAVFVFHFKVYEGNNDKNESDSNHLTVLMNKSIEINNSTPMCTEKYRNFEYKCPLKYSKLVTANGDVRYREVLIP